MSLTTTTFGGLVTFARSTTGTVVGSTGLIETVAINQPRFDYDPITLAAKGLLIEESRTNSIRNNTMVGAVAGTPGTMPTNWAVSLSSGLSSQIVGSGVEGGINYIDIRLFGTPTSGSSGIRFETNTVVAATSGQTWSGSVYLRKVAQVTGAISTLSANITGHTSGGANTSDSFSGSNAVSDSNFTVNNIVINRYSVTAVLADATTAFIRLQALVLHTSGVALDYTFRIGMPQLEIGSFPTSVITTSTVAVTRAADNASINTLAPWYNATEGTLYVEADSFAGTDVDNAATSLTDGTASNFMTIVTNLSGVNNVRHSMTTGGVAQVALASPNNSYFQGGTTYKAAVGYKSNDTAFACNLGPTLATDTSCAIPTVTKLLLGQYYTNGNRLLNGHLKKLQYYPRRLSNSELQALVA